MVDPTRMFRASCMEHLTMRKNEKNYKRVSLTEKIKGMSGKINSLQMQKLALKLEDQNGKRKFKNTLIINKAFELMKNYVRSNTDVSLEDKMGIGVTNRVSQKIASR